jgi:hypothetical protein
LLLPGFAPAAVFAANEQGLALLGDLENVRPVPQPNRITDDEDNN